MSNARARFGLAALMTDGDLTSGENRRHLRHDGRELRISVRIFGSRPKRQTAALHQLPPEDFEHGKPGCDARYVAPLRCVKVSRFEPGVLFFKAARSPLDAVRESGSGFITLLSHDEPIVRS